MNVTPEARIRRYLRVALDPEDVAAPAAPRRWAVAGRAAVRLGVVLLLVGLAVGGYLAFARAPAPAAPIAQPAPVPSSAPADAANQAGATVTVHVAGAVAEPGVVSLPADARVIDAVTAAGGATAEADLDRLNLAAVIVDGSQIYVPVVGESLAMVDGAGGSGGASGAQAGGTAGVGGGLVNLNTADAAALDTLPGVGPAIAQRIIEFRDQNGPFASVESLADVSGIGPATMERLRDLVTV